MTVTVWLSAPVAVPDFIHSLHLSDTDRGLLNSAFFWSYALLQIPENHEFPGTGQTGNGISANMLTQAHWIDRLKDGVPHLKMDEHLKARNTDG